MTYSPVLVIPVEPLWIIIVWFGATLKQHTTYSMNIDIVDYHSIADGLLDMKMQKKMYK